jgi:hypothetical protein
MGLDITAYSNLRAVGQHESCEDENHIHAYAYAEFPASFRGIPVLSEKTGWGETPLIDGGCYEPTDTTKAHAFQAGSYHGYNLWRADLAGQFNSPVNRPDPDKPFYELIWFADNEGCIGPEAAADLLLDFREHAAIYAPSHDREYSREKYRSWTRACELAADNGLIRFH